MLDRGRSSSAPCLRKEALSTCSPFLLPFCCLIKREVLVRPSRSDRHVVDVPVAVAVLVLVLITRTGLRGRRGGPGEVDQVLGVLLVPDGLGGSPATDDRTMLLRGRDTQGGGRGKKATGGTTGCPPSSTALTRRPCWKCRPRGQPPRRCASRLCPDASRAGQ